MTNVVDYDKTKFTKDAYGNLYPKPPKKKIKKSKKRKPDYAP